MNNVNGIAACIYNFESPMKNPHNVDMLREQYAMVWGKDTHMTDYCVKKAAVMIDMPYSELIVIEKQPIEKDFCFGESGYDYHDAQRMAAHARTSEDYFTSENMKRFNDTIRGLTDAQNEVRLAVNDSRSGCFSSAPWVVIDTFPLYNGQPDECRLRSWRFARLNDLIDACGGSCFLRELPGRELTVRFQHCRVANANEIEVLIEAYRMAAASHENKIAKYLKRYGLTKVHSWTYWRDA